METQDADILTLRLAAKSEVMSQSHCNLALRQLEALILDIIEHPEELAVATLSAFLADQHMLSMGPLTPATAAEAGRLADEGVQCFGYVVAENMQILPRGGLGELLVDGSVKNGEEQVELSVTTTQLVKVWRTGQLVRMLDTGSIKFYGNMRDHAKLRGTLINLSEVATVLTAAHENVESVVPLVIQHPRQPREKLVAVVILKPETPEGSTATPEELQPISPSHSLKAPLSKACRTLPLHMVPSYLFAYHQTARHDHGSLRQKFQKLDSGTLRLGETQPSDDDTAAWSDEEIVVRNAIANLANVPPESILKTTSIFQVGLDSISAMRLSSKLQSDDINLAVSEIMRNPTIERMLANRDARAGAADKNSGGEGDKHLQYLESFKQRAFAEISSRTEVSDIIDVYPCTPLQEGMLLQSLKSNMTLYFNHFIFQLRADVNVEKLRQAWQTVIRRTDILRTSFHMIEDEKFSQVQVLRGDVWMPWVERSVDSDTDDALSRAGEDYIRWVVENTTLKRPPLAFGLIKSRSRTWLIVDLHHALYDAFSLEMILEDVRAEYSGANPVARPSFKDIAHYVACYDEDEGRRFWVDALSGCETTIFCAEALEVEGTLACDLRCGMDLDTIEAVCQDIGVTVQAVGQAAWGVVLATTIEEKDVVVGS